MKRITNYISEALKIKSGANIHRTDINITNDAADELKDISTNLGSYMPTASIVSYSDNMGFKLVAPKKCPNLISLLFPDCDLEKSKKSGVAVIRFIFEIEANDVYDFLLLVDDEVKIEIVYKDKNNDNVTKEYYVFCPKGITCHGKTQDELKDYIKTNLISKHFNIKTVDKFVLMFKYIKENFKRPDTLLLPNNIVKANV